MHLIHRWPPGPSSRERTQRRRRLRKEKADLHRAGLKPVAEASAATLPPTTVVASTTNEATFLKRLHHGACSVFGTVLGPEANEAHRDHFHLDMKERKGAGICH